VMVKLAKGLAKIAVKRAGGKTFSAPCSVFTYGNSKLPFAGFSTLPGHTCPGAGECLEWCYSFKAWRHVGAWARQLSNTLLLKFRPDIVRQMFDGLEAEIILRLYVDGDFGSMADIDFWFSALKARPDIRAYGYSKSWDLLWSWGTKNVFPANYQLNLSSGGRPQQVSREAMHKLSIARGDFLTIPIEYHGVKGFARYDDPLYHRAVRDAATKMGLGKVFSCPGKCGECAAGEHACGSKRFSGVTIVNGTH